MGLLQIVIKTALRARHIPGEGVIIHYTMP